MPAYGRHHTAQLLKLHNHYILIDCGEGTQLQLLKYRVKFQKIDQVFISHLHGDHYLGLVGLIKTLHLLRRTKPFQVFGPRGLQEIITTQLQYSDTRLNYTIDFYETNPNEAETIYENQQFFVRSFPLQHRIPCTGFLFKEKKKPYKINKAALPKDLSLVNIARLKKGEDPLDMQGNKLYDYQALTLPPKKSRAYAFCSDTRYDENILTYINGVDLLYHEATFNNEDLPIAEQTYHSTARQAASIALKSNATKLLLGHFSARYRSLNTIEQEAKEVFEETYMAIEGNDYFIKEE